MTPERIITMLLSTLSLVGTVLTIIVVIVKIKPELKKTDAETSSLFLKIATEAGLQIVLRDKQIAHLEVEIGELRGALQKIEDKHQQEISGLNCRITELDTKFQVYRGWATRLAHQLKAHDIIPVPMVPDEGTPK